MQIDLDIAFGLEQSETSRCESTLNFAAPVIYLFSHLNGFCLFPADKSRSMKQGLATIQ